MTDKDKKLEETFTKKELDNLDRLLKRDHPNKELNSFLGIFKMKSTYEKGKNMLHENGGHI